MALKWIKDFNSLIYPHLCASCNKTLYSHESCICIFCKVSFPKTNFHLEADNPVSKIFWGRVEIFSASAYCYFKKGDRMQHLMHQLKYKGNKRVGIELGRIYGHTLKDSTLFSTVNYVIPVPLHPSRERKRGYNQATQIALGMGESMQVKVDDQTLYRGTANATQTKKSHFDRWKNVESIFQLKDSNKFSGKHVLLVDDVVTTGSTLEACAQTLHAVNDIKISIATIACA